VLEDIRANGVTETELARAKKTFLADYIYESDNQASLARRYGWGVAVGRSVKDIEAWPQAISNVTLDDIKHAADTYLDLRGSVTGYLLPEEPEGAGKRVEQPVAHSRS
jgi:zinc protease